MTDYTLILLVYALPYLQIVFPYDVCVTVATVLIPSAFWKITLPCAISACGVVAEAFKWP